MKLRERLAGLRRERGWTLRELRERIEERTGERTSISYLSEVERADGYPSVETLARLARAYDLTLQQLLAPVEILGSDADGEDHYPRALRLLREQHRIDPEWASTLERIEFRGRRLETEDEWLAIYAILKALLEPKLRDNLR